MKVHAAMKRFRKKFKLTQREVAEILGIHPNSYQLYEYGKISPSIDSIIKLADIYNLSTDYMLGRTDSPHPTPIDEELAQAIREVHSAVNNVWEKCKEN